MRNGMNCKNNDFLERRVSGNYTFIVLIIFCFFVIRDKLKTVIDKQYMKN